MTDLLLLSRPQLQNITNSLYKLLCRLAEYDSESLPTHRPSFDEGSMTLSSFDAITSRVFKTVNLPFDTNRIYLGTDFYYDVSGALFKKMYTVNDLLSQIKETTQIDPEYEKLLPANVYKTWQSEKNQRLIQKLVDSAAPSCIDDKNKFIEV